MHVIHFRHAIPEVPPDQPDARRSERQRHSGPAYPDELVDDAQQRAAEIALVGADSAEEDDHGQDDQAQADEIKLAIQR